MSNKGKFIDNTPFIPPAGMTTALEGVSVDNSLRQDLYFQPKTQTPAEILKYRNSTRERVGVKQLHPGIFNDPKDYEEYIHGVKTKNSDHVVDCIKGTDLNGNKYFMDQLKEKHYASSKREPLGKSLQRDYVFPETVHKEDFRFGIPTTGFYNAKDVIYNGSLLHEPEEAKKLYRKTHGLTDPGEQKDREYNWIFDKNEHTFGLGQEKEQDGAKKSLMTDNLNGPCPQTKIAGKRLEDFRQATSDMLGRSKFRGTLSDKIGPDHTFGKKSTLGDAWNAGRCIHGDASTVTDKSLEPDIDLGRDSHYASKLKNVQPLQRDPNKVYGIPSIRRDLQKKEFVSVCDLNNYGNEKDAFELLYPHPCAPRGLDDEDFDALLTKDEIADILNKNQIEVPQEEYNLIYQIGLKNYPNEEGKMSANAFISTMRNLKREYMKYRTLVNMNN